MLVQWSRTAARGTSASALSSWACSGHDVRVLQSYLTLAGTRSNIDAASVHDQANVVKFELANALTGNGVMTYA